jgi:hypothetical protein
MRATGAAVFGLAMLLFRMSYGQSGFADITASLKDYYRDGADSPPWKSAVDQLAAKESDARQSAATYLRVLLEQSLKDQKSGVAPWRATPYWGQNGENPARVLREPIIEALLEVNVPDEEVPVLGWYIDQQDDQNQAAKAAEALAKVVGPQADSLLAQLATRPYTNSAVETTALKQAGRRKLAVKTEEVASLCQSHHQRIRDAAREIARQRGINGINAYSDSAAMKSTAIAKLIDEISELVIEPPGADAPFVTITSKEFDGAREVEASINRGWLLETKDGKATLLTPFGKKRIFELADKPKVANARGYTFACVCTPLAIEQEVTRVADLQRNGDPDFALSERGGLTGQFLGHGAGLYEVMLAQWLYTTNRLDLAGELLFPALDSCFEDEDLVEVTRQRLGVLLQLSHDSEPSWRPQLSASSKVGECDQGEICGDAC